MRQDEFLILRGRPLTSSPSSRARNERSTRAIDIALRSAVTESQAIATREARRFGRRALELVDHLAFGDRDAPERNGKADLFGKELDLDLTETDFSDEGMRAAVATLRRIAKRQQEAFVATPRDFANAIHGLPETPVARASSPRQADQSSVGGRTLDQIIRTEKIGDSRRRLR